MKAALGAVLIIAAALIIPKCKAETSVVMTLGSRHLGGGDYCETNPGLGLEHNWQVAGFYKNSLCRTSVYIGARYVPLQYGSWRGGVTSLAITGYEDPVTVGVGLVLTYDKSINVIWFPNKRGEFHNGVIGVQYVRPF